MQIAAREAGRRPQTNPRELGAAPAVPRVLGGVARFKEKLRFEEVRVPRWSEAGKLGAILLLLAAIAGCSPSQPPAQPTASPTPTPTPPPTPAPTPVHIPFKKLETSKLFNGMEVRSSLEAEFGTSATVERANPESYSLDLKLKVRVPQAKFELSQLTGINPLLPQVLPALESLLKEAKVSHFFGDFYGLKVASLQRNLARLDVLLSRHNFYDCETILELQHPETKRRALLIQSDMDIDMDGSDSDRVPLVDGSSANFQPMTSYKWPKKTELPNPFLAGRESKLLQLETELAGASKSGSTRALERVREMREAIPALRYEVSQLKTMSFLVAATDPYVVLPGSIVGKNREPFTPHLGDYCVVIFGDKIYPAIVGDVGPSSKLGEASLRLGKEINPKTTAYSRSSNDLKVTYLVFPNSADKPWSPPNLDKWRERCDQLLKELGGYQGELHAWENLIKPLPTPTPSPSAFPNSSPNPAAPSVSGTLPVQPPTPSATPTATGSGSATTSGTVP